MENPDDFEDDIPQTKILCFTVSEIAEDMNNDNVNGNMEYLTYCDEEHLEMGADEDNRDDNHINMIYQKENDLEYQWDDMIENENEQNGIEGESSNAEEYCSQLEQLIDKEEKELNLDNANKINEIIFEIEDSTENHIDNNKKLYHCIACNIIFYSLNEHVNEFHGNKMMQDYQIDQDKDEIDGDNITLNNAESLIIYDENSDDGDHKANFTVNEQYEVQQENDENDIVIDEGVMYKDAETVLDIPVKLECIENEEYVEEELFNDDDSIAIETVENENEKSSQVCAECEEIITDDYNHICLQNKDKIVFGCGLCGVEFSSKRSLASHKKVHSSKKKKLTEPIKEKIKIKKTREFVQEQKSFKCEICNTVFPSRKNIILHSKMHTPASIANSFDRIINTEKKIIGKSGHLSNEHFWCEICNKSYDKVFQEIHEKAHETVEEFNCKICNKKFENDIDLTIHMKLHENRPKRRGITKAEIAGIKLPYECTYCGRQFKKPHEKVKHERIHTGERPFKCDICGKCFRVAYCLTLHIRTHTNARPYVCPTCNKRFKAVSVYNHHLASHSEERSFKCEQCPKSFKTAVSLAGHRKSHTKPFVCVECNRPFASLYSVKTHMETHKKSKTNLKHSCIICGAIYAKIFALRDHMKQQHENVFYESDTANDEIIDIETNIINSTADVEQLAMLVNKEEDEAQMQITVSDVENFHTEEIVTDELW